MASPLSDLLPYVLQHVPSCTDTQAETAILETVIDFYQRAALYSVDLDPIDVVADQAEYDLTNPDGFQIQHVRSGLISTYELLATSEEQLDLNWKDLNCGFTWRYDYDGVFDGPMPPDSWRHAVSPIPGLVYTPTPNVARLVGIPTEDIDAALILKVVCYPTQAIEEIDDWIYNRYWQVLRDGAVGKLKSMTNKPYTDLRTATDYSDKYEDGVIIAHGAALRSYQRNDRPHLRTR